MNASFELLVVPKLICETKVVKGSNALLAKDLPFNWRVPTTLRSNLNSSFSEPIFSKY